MWATIGQAIWGILQPYIVPFMAAIAGEEWRRQYDAVKTAKADAEQKQAALDLAKVGRDEPVAGAADSLRASKWNRRA